MFRKNYEQRLSAWKELRKSLDSSSDPLQDTIDFFKQAPLTKFQCDPYDRATWPAPWEIIQENTYCPFVKILAYCYTLQLTDKFLGKSFEIHIMYNPTDSSINYLLFVGDRVLGYLDDTHVARNDLDENLVSQEVYLMAPLH